MPGAVPLRRQAAAVVALVAATALVAVVVAFVPGARGSLTMGLAGLALAGAGAWWVVTERVPRRAAGVGAVAAGLLLIAFAIARVVDGSGPVALRVVVVAGLLAVAAGAARAALVPDLPRMAVRQRKLSPPAHAVLLCNPAAGGGKVEEFGLLALAAELGVETVVLDEGDDLEQLARAAVARGADCLGMAGGDGSQAVVASVAVEHDLPFVCVSAGTRNHFAQDLGLDRDDPRPTMLAFRDAIERRVDYGTIGDRLFVNNVSLGAYATIVQDDAYREAKADTTLSLLPELLGAQAEPFDLQFTAPDGDEVDGAFLIQVSNNPYVIGAQPDASQRRRLDRGVLGVIAVSAGTGVEAGRVAAMVAVGQRRRCSGWYELTPRSFEVRSRSGSAPAAVDGEAVKLPTPMRFRIHHLGLRLLVPAGNVEEATRRRARDIDLRALVTVARGRAPQPGRRRS
jgi:diacylglycerol kinase family enzyme